MAKSVEELRTQLRGLTLDKGIRKMFELMLDDLEDTRDAIQELRSRPVTSGGCGRYPCICGDCK